MSSDLIFYNEERLDEMEREIHEGITVYPATENPQDISTTAPSVGTSEKYAREDHVHKILTAPGELTQPIVIKNSAGNITRILNGCSFSANTSSPTTIANRFWVRLPTDLCASNDGFGIISVRIKHYIDYNDTSCLYNIMFNASGNAVSSTWVEGDFWEVTGGVIETSTSQKYLKFERLNNAGTITQTDQPIYVTIEDIRLSSGFVSTATAADIAKGTFSLTGTGGGVLTYEGLIPRIYPPSSKSIYLTADTSFPTSYMNYGNWEKIGDFKIGSTTINAYMQKQY
jgi:hypothetical protein